MLQLSRSARDELHALAKSVKLVYQEAMRKHNWNPDSLVYVGALIRGANHDPKHELEQLAVMLYFRQVDPVKYITWCVESSDRDLCMPAFNYAANPVHLSRYLAECKEESAKKSA